MTLWQVSKVRSILCDHRGARTKNVNLPTSGGKSIRLVMDDDEVEEGTDDLLGYYWKLVIMFNTWAYVGAFQVESALHRGRTLQMFDLATALSYPQRALMHATAKGPPGRQAEWLENKDLATRGIWLTLVNQNMPAAEALAEALDRTRTDWNSREFTTLPGRDS
jgi:hypothetical protein